MSRKNPAVEKNTADPSSPVPGTVEETAAPPGEGIQAADAQETVSDPFAHVNDEHWGKGGRFIVVDGQRVPAPVNDSTEEHHG